VVLRIRPALFSSPALLATLVQGPVSATLRYIDAESSKTFSGDCVAGTPLAVCALNIDDLDPPQVTMRDNAEEGRKPMETGRAGVHTGGSEASRDLRTGFWVCCALGTLVMQYLL
jgi:hypothetical protein